MINGFSVQKFTYFMGMKYIRYSHSVSFCWTKKIDENRKEEKDNFGLVLYAKMWNPITCCWCRSLTSSESHLSLNTYTKKKMRNKDEQKKNHENRIEIIYFGWCSVVFFFFLVSLLFFISCLHSFVTAG